MDQDEPVLESARTADQPCTACGSPSVMTIRMAFEGSPVFNGLLPLATQPPTQAEPLYRYRFTVNYVQKL